MLPLTIPQAAALQASVRLNIATQLASALLSQTRIEPTLENGIRLTSDSSELTDDELILYAYRLADLLIAGATTIAKVS
jgi:hypothetical protein